MGSSSSSTKNVFEIIKQFPNLNKVISFRVSRDIKNSPRAPYKVEIPVGDKVDDIVYNIVLKNNGFRSAMLTLGTHSINGTLYENNWMFKLEIPLFKLQNERCFIIVITDSPPVDIIEMKYDSSGGIPQGMKSDLCREPLKSGNIVFHEGTVF